MKFYYTYILANQKNGTLYAGVTSDLISRVWEHKNNCVEGFTKRYTVHKLVFFEMHESIETALLREKQIKRWRRKWKLALVEEKNPTWLDLSHNLF